MKHVSRFLSILAVGLFALSISTFTAEAGGKPSSGYNQPQGHSPQPGHQCKPDGPQKGGQSGRQNDGRGNGHK
jgi:hypothetical protein